MKKLACFTLVLGAAGALVFSCTPSRPEPGSDLPVPKDGGADVEELPPTTGGAVLDGTYAAPTFMQTADKLVKMTLSFIWVVKQSGKFEPGDAKLGGTVHIDGFEPATKMSFADVPISSQGEFTVEIQNMMIPKELNTALTGNVVKSVLTYSGCRIIDSCRFACQVHAKLLDVPSFVGQLPQVDADGSFTAVSTNPACQTDAGPGDAEAGAPDAKPDTQPDTTPGPDADAGAPDGSEAGPGDAADTGTDVSAEASTDADAQSSEAGDVEVEQ
jgi:hypothetical protein